MGLLADRGRAARIRGHERQQRRNAARRPARGGLTDAGLRQAEETGTVLFRRWSAGGPPGLAVTELDIAEPGLSGTESDVQEAVSAFVARI
ncbi:hypothetical protein [Streptomyces sp. NPDC090021]|uniref:hypothetical protein n=1 Tax=Streptomyces sp. NPDC090021 TaxID=3365919 RepID=UPI003807196C